MRKLSIVLILTMIFLVLNVSGQMMYFNSILYCASSVKGLVDNYHSIGQNYENPHELIKIASKSLKAMPELLDNCGKQIYAKLLQHFLSR